MFFKKLVLAGLLLFAATLYGCSGPYYGGYGYGYYDNGPFYDDGFVYWGTFGHDHDHDRGDDSGHGGRGGHWGGEHEGRGGGFHDGGHDGGHGYGGGHGNH